MKIARFLVLALTAAVMAGPTGAGCSCKSSKVAADLNLQIDPVGLNFGTVALGQSLPLTLTLTHVGDNGIIELADVYLEDVSLDDFSFSGPEKDTLSPGESVTITVTYAPKDSLADSGALVITHNVVQQGNLSRVYITANAQAGDLLANPNPIDFEQVEVGTTKDLDVYLQNYGSDAVLIKEIYLRLDGSLDFSILSIELPEGTAALPVTLPPGEKLPLIMRYEPTGGGEDRSTLVVGGETQGQFAAWSFDVMGEELGPHLVATPGELNFLGVPLDTEKELLLVVANEGNADLVVPAGGLTLWPGSDEHIVVKNQPAEDLRIAPGASHDFTVGWTPTVVQPPTGEPIGRLMIASNDLAQSPTPIPVYGQVDAPILTVIPEAIDLGFGAQMTPVERTVTLSNVGTGLLNVTSMSIVDVVGGEAGKVELEINRAGTQSDTIGAFDIAGNAFEPVKVVFTNRGSDKGTVTAKLRIVSNYKGHEAMDVPITVQRSGSPVCKAALVPAGMNFGTVAIGFPEEKPVNIVNVGTGYCVFQRARITDCTSGMFGGATCGAPFSGAQSTIFQFKSVPAGNTELAPGSTTTMFVRFNPPNSSPLFGLLNSYSGLMAIEVKDKVLGNTIQVPQGAGNPATYQANVLGASGIAKVSVLPGEVKFGVTTIGCFSKTYKVCVYNSGNAPLKITDIVMSGCTPEFKLKNVPKLPLAVPNGAPKCFETVYAPQDVGEDQCVVQIDVTDQSTPTVVVKLSGAGTYETKQVDEFTQVTGQEVDILFVIDDSGSMSEEQSRLSQSFTDFITHANVWNNDYHIGAISVNVVDEGVIGRLNRGDNKITPRYLTKTSGGSFAKLVQYGSGGGSDSQEAGLQAAQTGLSAPLATDTGIPCGSTTDCKNDANICPDPATCGYECVDGKCGGYNAGFLRPDAQLEIVMLSDEEDQSSQGTPFYVDFFKNIKGWYNVDMMHVNAIVGMDGIPSSPPSSGEGDCVASDGGIADEGKRYLDVAQQTGGLTGSICESSYGPIMNKIGDVSFHPKVQFFLTRLADPATVVVSVEGTKCTSGWRYDAPSNSVIFDPDGTCMPDPGEKIRIEYETLCLTS